MSEGDELAPGVDYPGGEWRQDLLTGTWHVVAPRRGGRPMAVGSRPSAARDATASPAGCPFCPGHESEIPAILEETPGPDPAGWRTRAVVNRYPAFAPDGHEGLGEGRRAVGWQEVLVETPRHDHDWPDFSDDEADAVMNLYLGRLSAALARPGHSAFLFRNRGRESGSSQAHPHAQLVAVRGVPPAVEARAEAQRRHRARTGGCAVCALRDLEPDHEARVVAANGEWTALVPWAPGDPYHLRILPRRHVSTLTRLRDDERHGLARMLRDLLRALRDGAGDPHYNLLFHDHGLGQDPALHAFVEIRTRFSRTAGFELMTGTGIAVSDPREDAALLRETLAAATEA